MVYIVIEHLEPGVGKWATLEYTHLCRQSHEIYQGKAKIVFTNVVVGSEDERIIKEICTAYNTTCTCVPESCAEYVMQTMKATPNSVCILDPVAPLELVPGDLATHEYFVFGGILGTHPMDGRTGREVTRHFPPEVSQRHLGTLQMTTDTAVLVTLRVVLGQEPLSSMEYVDNAKFKVNACETVKMKGFRYMKDPVTGRGSLPPGMMEMWQSDESIA
eukprot:PhF_6_TR25633/c0_g1_i1/m.36036